MAQVDRVSVVAVVVVIVAVVVVSADVGVGVEMLALVARLAVFLAAWVDLAVGGLVET